MKKAVQFGAGNIGRGFLGQLFFQSKYEIVFVDIDERLISALNERGLYPLRVVNEHLQELVIRGVRAVNVSEVEKVAEEMAGADIAATAVGTKALCQVAPLIARGMEERARRKVKAPLNLIIAENLLQAGKVLKGYIFESISGEYKTYVENHLGLIESVVSRMVPVVPEELKKKDLLLVMVEAYATLPVAKKAFKGEIPQIEGMVAYENLGAYEERKLFTHNCGHAMAAYLGYLKGYRYIYQAVEDVEIRGKVLKALQESGQALIKKHGFSSPDHQEHIRDLLKRFGNVALGDTVARVGREPIRKLGPEDRLVGAAKLALQYGIKPENLSLGIAAALRYDNPEDEQAVKLAKQLRERGVDWVSENICHLNKEEELARMIKEAAEKLLQRP